MAWKYNPFTGQLDYYEDGGPAISSLTTVEYAAMTTQSVSAAFTVDWTAHHIQKVTITGTNLDITFTDPANGPCRLYLFVVQGDGSDTIDWTNETDIKWPGGVAPTLSTGSGDVDLVSFIWDGTSYYGVANYDFS